MNGPRGPRQVLPPRVIHRMSEQLPHPQDEFVGLDVDAGRLHLRARVPPAAGTVLRLVVPATDARGTPHPTPGFTLQGVAAPSFEGGDTHAYCAVVDPAARDALLAWLGWSPIAVVTEPHSADMLAELRDISVQRGEMQGSPIAAAPWMDVDAVLVEFELAPPQEDDALDLAGHTLHLSEVALDDDELSLLDGPAPRVSGAGRVHLRGSSTSLRNPIRLDVAMKADLATLEVVLPALPPSAEGLRSSPPTGPGTFQPFQDDEATVAVPAVAMQALDFDFLSRRDGVGGDDELASERPRPRETSGLAEAGVGYSQLHRDLVDKAKTSTTVDEARPGQQRPPSPVATPLHQLLVPLAGWPPGRRPTRR